MRFVLCYLLPRVYRWQMYPIELFKIKNKKVNKLRTGKNGQKSDPLSWVVLGKILLNKKTVTITFTGKRHQVTKSCFPAKKNWNPKKVFFIFCVNEKKMRRLLRNSLTFLRKLFSRFCFQENSLPLPPLLFCPLCYTLYPLEILYTRDRHKKDKTAMVGGDPGPAPMIKFHSRVATLQ